MCSNRSVVIFWYASGNKATFWAYPGAFEILSVCHKVCFCNIYARIVKLAPAFATLKQFTYNNVLIATRAIPHPFELN